MRRPGWLWQTYLLAKTWKTRPSELLFITDELAAFCLDRAVAHFGDALTAELEGVEAKNAKEGQRKRMKILRKWLPDSAPAVKFRNPAMAKKG